MNMARQGSTDELYYDSIDDNETTDQDEFVPERDTIGAIGAELEKARQLQAEDVPENIGMFTIKTANRTIREAAGVPIRPLFG